MSNLFATASFGHHASWVFLDGFPLILNVICWIACASVMVCWWSRRGVVEPERPRQTEPRRRLSPSARQTHAYKRGGVWLLIVGVLIGFGPSLALLIATGKAWSVNRVQPHTDIDHSIVVHVPLAILWSVAFAIQLWSGGIGPRRKIHRISGWVTVVSGWFGISLAAAWIWTYFNDFTNGFTGPRASAGFYTVILGIGVAANIGLLIHYARRHDYLRHKDHAMMALLWSLDPGVHRTMMWAMRLYDWDCWAPENTAEMGIALAKLPANLLLIAWAVAIASGAGRVNRIILANVTGQLMLFLLSSHGLMKGPFEGGPATLVVSITALLAVGSMYALIGLTKNR